MQAIVLFMMFGALMATVSGIISTGSETSRQIKLDRNQETVNFFIQAENILRDRITFQEMEIADASTCDGAAVSSNATYGVVNAKYDPRPYLCRMEVRQLASWGMGTNNIIDFWRSDITGVVVRRMQAVGPGVQAPVTAMAFISPGPDKTVSPALLAKLKSVRQAAAAGTATFRDVLSLSADLDRTAGNYTDDIVHTFSNLTNQQDRWKEISDNVDRIMIAMQESYLKQYDAFAPALQLYYASNPGTLTSMYSWKLSPLIGKPSLAMPNLNNLSERPSLGVDEAFEQITSAIPTGSSMSISSLAYNGGAIAGATDLDTLRLTLSNNSSPWTVNYTKTMTMAP